MVLQNRGDNMIKLVALEDFYAAEDGIHTRHYIKGDKFTVTSKEFMDLLIKKGHADVPKLETKVVEPKETKASKTQEVKAETKPSK